jgi:type VI secretion system secreted protein VgrG
MALQQQTLEQSRPPAIEVLFGSPQQVLATLEMVSLETRQAVNQIPNAKLVLRQPGGDGSELSAFATDAGRCQPGAPVTIRLGNGEVLFKGVVADQSCSQTQGRNELTLRLCHPLQGSVSSHGSRIFTRITEEAVLRQLLQPYGLTLTRAQGLLQEQHEQLVQYECSDWQFIKARLYANAVWLWPDCVGNLALAPPVLGAIRHTLIRRDLTGVDASSAHNVPLIESIDWLFRSRELSDSVEVANWDPVQQTMAGRQALLVPLGSGALNPALIKRLGPASQDFHASLPLPHGERQAWADARLLAMRAASIQARATLIGSTAYELGETLALRGFGSSFDGTGIVTGIEHKFVPGRWRTVLALGQDQQPDADSALLPSVPGLHIGVVAGYQQDPLRLNRLRVQVPVFNGELWARFAAPYASDNSGLCFYPEPGDEVVLGFFGADPRYPVILGAMHNPSKPAPIDPSEGMQHKGIIFRQGNSLQQLLFDSDPVQLVLQAGQDKLVLQQGLSVETEQAVAVQAGEFKLTADTNVEIAGRQVKIKGSKVDLGM